MTFKWRYVIHHYHMHVGTTTDRTAQTSNLIGWHINKLADLNDLDVVQ